MRDNHAVDEQALPEYVPAGVGKELLGGAQEHGAFFYYVRTGQIRKRSHPTKQRETLYSRDDILRIRDKRNKKKREEPAAPSIIGMTDWVQYDDLPALQELDFKMYGPENTVPISVTHAWWKKNPCMCRILFNAQDRKDIWGAITIMPMEEETIFRILRDELTEKQITPDDILTYENSGKYNAYVPSAMILPDRRGLFRTLLQSVFTFYCEQYPHIQLNRIYAFALTDEGLALMRHLFFAPRYDLGENAFELDPYRHTPSKVLKVFQRCIQEKQVGK